jgi:protein-tyrosine phosphatase
VVNLRAEFDDQIAALAPARYLYLPTVDDQAPTLEQMHAGVDFITEELQNGGSVYVHCKSGVGRAAIMAAAYLTSTGLEPSDAWAAIEKVRPFIRPTSAQVAQLERFAAGAQPAD